MEQSFEVKVIRTILRCDVCGAEMKRSNYVLATFPATYSYKCPKCETTMNSKESYPKTEYVKVKGEKK